MADPDPSEVTRYVTDADLLEGVAMGGCCDYRCTCEVVIDSPPDETTETVLLWWMGTDIPRGIC